MAIARPVLPPGPPLVLHVIHHLATGGLENGLVNLVNAMPPAAFRHAIACVEDYSAFRDRVTDPQIGVFALHRSRVGVWRLRREFYRLCRRLQPAIVHTRNLSGLDAMLPARAAGVRRIVHGEHGWDTADIDGTARRPALLRRLRAPLVDRYITVSRDLERYLVRRVGVAPGRITQIYNGVDTARFAPGGAAERGVLPAGFAPAGTCVIGTVGRIQPVKDQAALLRAFAALAASAPALAAHARLAIVGDGPLLAELRAQAVQLGIGAVTWFAGSRDDIPAILRALDVFALPSRNEGISNTLLEAMATGLPAVASAVGGNGELVEDGATGALFPAGDATALARALERYVADPTLRAAHGARARAVAAERFSLPSMVAAYRGVYETLTR
ncbi:MAG: TIGR03088 family PEP-CTERM/XrtA system glycosyltransferase [Betaproteobacteria bacterium]